MGKEKREDKQFEWIICSNSSFVPYKLLLLPTGSLQQETVRRADFSFTPEQNSVSIVCVVCMLFMNAVTKGQFSPLK